MSLRSVFVKTIPAERQQLGRIKMGSVARRALLSQLGPQSKRTVIKKKKNAAASRAPNGHKVYAVIECAGNVIEQQAKAHSLVLTGRSTATPQNFPLDSLQL